MKTIRFTKLRFWMIALSVVVIAGGIAVTVISGGFNLGVDFQPGLSMRVEINSSNATIESVRTAVADLEGADVQTIGDESDRQFTVQVRDNGEIDGFASTMSSRVLERLESAFGDGNLVELESNYVGPRFSEDLVRNTVLLISLALALILLYIWFRFRLGYATASIVALLHDVAFMFAFIGAFQIEVSVATIAAILTIIGYSLNDTIVIFDRIRENENVMRESGFEGIINASITQSLSRTLITSITTLLAVSAIFIFATGQVRSFALNLMVGVIVGTYSSVFVASPVLLGWRRASRKKKVKKEAERHGGPVTAKKLEEAKDAAPSAEKQSITADEKAKVVEELRKKRAISGGKGSSRQKRKKKK